MNERLLTDSSIYPDDQVLKEKLGRRYGTYCGISETADSFEGTDYLWKYYNDGKSWLCRFLYKKKTIFWLSVWEDCIKTAFYFSGKTAAGIETLVIDESEKKKFLETELIGKLKPFIIEHTDSSKLELLSALIDYKIHNL